MNIEVLHFEDEEFISRRPKVKNFVEEYVSYLKGELGKKNPYRDPDNYRKCREIYKMSKRIWGDYLPDVWGTDQLGFSAPSDRRTIYGKYLDESDDYDKYEFVAKCIYDTRTIGGCFIWPKVKREGLGEVSEYNKVRGGSKKGKIFLEDRPDIALLEIQHFYEKYKTYGTNVYSEFISQYKADVLNKNWMIFDYTSNYPSNNVEYEKMFIWLSKFEKFENYCKHFGFIGNFVVKECEDLKIVDIVKSDLPNEEYVFISQPVDYSIYDLQINEIRKMLDNVQRLVMERSREIGDK